MCIFRGTFIPCKLFFSFLRWGETESTWYCGHFWPTVPAPDDRWRWLWSSRWNENTDDGVRSQNRTCKGTNMQYISLWHKHMIRSSRRVPSRYLVKFLHLSPFSYCVNKTHLMSCLCTYLSSDICDLLLGYCQNSTERCNIVKTNGIGTTLQVS
jgi:hypothetical protein